MGTAATFPMGSSTNDLPPASKAQGSGQSPSNQTPEDFVETKWRETKEAYTSYHMLAWESILMQAGETWVKWDANRKQFSPDQPADDWTPTPRINRFAPTVDAIAANVMTVPAIEATPKGDKGDPMQWGIADVATKLADDWLTVSGLRAGSNREDDKVGEAGMAFVLCGSVFTEVQPKSSRTHSEPMKTPQPVVQGTCPQCNQFYDDLQPVPETQSYVCPTCNLQIQNVQPGTLLKPVMLPDGSGPQMATMDLVDACVNVGLPIYAHPRVGSKGMESADYFFWAERKTINYIKLELQIDDADPDDEQVDGFSVGYEHALAYFYQGVSQTTKANKDSALVVWCYVRPGKVADFPDGFKAVMINNKVKRVDPWTYDNDHPYTYAVYQRLLTLFFGRSVSFELAGLQKEYQQYESTISLHAKTSAVDSIVIDANTQVSEITGRADKIIKWRSIGPGSREPHRMEHGQLDDGIYKQRQSLRDEFENVSGAVGVYRGQQPGSITAASAIGKLQTQAEMMFSKPVQNWNGLWKETVRKAIRIRQQNWTIGMIAQVVGTDRLNEIRQFKSCDLDRTVDWVATTHGLPRSREEKKQEFIMLYDAGALDLSDPSIRETAFELFGDLGVMNNFNLDAKRARVENNDMKQGLPATVMPEVEDLAVHLAVHRECAKQLDFDDWPDQSKTLLLQHIMETLQSQAEQAMMMAPTPPPAPGGPSPSTGPAAPPGPAGRGGAGGRGAPSHGPGPASGPKPPGNQIAAPIEGPGGPA